MKTRLLAFHVFVLFVCILCSQEVLAFTITPIVDGGAEADDFLFLQKYRTSDKSIRGWVDLQVEPGRLMVNTNG